MVRVKVCGITSIQDYKTVNRHGADYTGFIFFKKSRRYIPPETAADIKMKDKRAMRVGVFVNEDPDMVKKIYKTADLDFVQLHGEESPDYCRKLNLPYLKVFRINSINSIIGIPEYDTEYILVDTFVKGRYGGTGKTINAQTLSGIIGMAKNLNKKIFVAGGLGPDNIVKILKLKPYAVDINSGVEITPGIKDPVKLNKLFSNIRNFNMEA